MFRWFVKILPLGFVIYMIKKFGGDYAVLSNGGKKICGKIYNINGMTGLFVCEIDELIQVRDKLQRKLESIDEKLEKLQRKERK